MASQTSPFPDKQGRKAFLRQFLRHPRQVASVIPSSRFLERRVVAAANPGAAQVVVELGPGTGGTTRALLDAMAPEGHLLSIELNPRLHELVSEIDDDRLIAHHGDAGELESILEQHRLPAPEVVVSGIPFSTMGDRAGARVLAAVSTALASDGRFVAYQVRGRVAELCEPYMGPCRKQVVLRNLPPMRVYTWEKGNGEA